MLVSFEKVPISEVTDTPTSISLERPPMKGLSPAPALLEKASV